ncbi:MAG: hypothetical protein V4678_03900 [Patescibacteria group bacterium]
MSSQDTMQVAEAEQRKAQDLEEQAQRVIDRAQQQADGFRRQAQVHTDQYSKLISKSQDEQRHETEEAAKAREEQARKDQERKDNFRLAA